MRENVVNQYEKEITQFVRNRIVDLKADHNNQSLAGLVVGLRMMKNKRGDNMAFVTLDDRTARIEITLFADAYEENREKITKDAILVVEGQVTFDDYSGQLKVRGKGVKTLLEARQSRVKALQIKLNAEDFNGVNGPQGFTQNLRQLLEPCLSGGQCPIAVNYQSADATGQLLLGEQWRVQPSDELIERLKDRFGPAAVTLKYSD